MTKLLNIDDLATKLAMTRVTALKTAREDPEFPDSIKFSNSNDGLRWDAEAVDRWIRSKFKQEVQA